MWRRARALVPRPDRQRVADDEPAGRCHPGRLEHVGARFVAAPGRHIDAVGGDAEAAGAAVEQRAEDARPVEARQAQPLDGSVGCDQRSAVAVGEERVVGDRRERGSALPLRRADRRPFLRFRGARPRRPRAARRPRRRGGRRRLRPRALRGRLSGSGGHAGDTIAARGWAELRVAKLALQWQESIRGRDAWKPLLSQHVSPPAVHRCRQPFCGCAPTSSLSRCSAADQTTPSARSTTATAHACWPTPARCCAAAAIRRTPSRTSSSAPTARCGQATGR